MSESDLHYLRSILRMLQQVQRFVVDGPTLQEEVLADNIDWLDCFIAKQVRK